MNGSEITGNKKQFTKSGRPSKFGIRTDLLTQDVHMWIVSQLPTCFSSKLHRKFTNPSAIQYLVGRQSKPHWSTNYQLVFFFRVHHKFTDTDADPHNSQRGFFFSHIGWLMVKKHPDVKTKGSTVDMSDLERDPIVMFQKK